MLEGKKKAYGEYRKARDEMKEFLTAKANVDRILKIDEEQKHGQELEKGHGQL